MNKTQLSRWNAAKVLFEKLIYTSEHKGCAIWYDGDVVTSDQIVISSDQIYVKIGNSIFLQFSVDPEYDEGLFTCKADYAETVKRSFRLVKFVKW